MSTEAAKAYMQGVRLGWTAPIARAEEWVPKIEAEARRAALTALRAEVAEWAPGFYPRTAVLAAIDRALGEP